MPRTVYEYYSALRHFGDVFDRDARRMPAVDESLESFKRWQKEAREKLGEILGFEFMEKCELDPRVIDSAKYDGFRRDRVLIQAEPDMDIPLIVLVPDDIKPGERRPVFMSFFGHGSALFAVDSYTPGVEPVSRFPKRPGDPEKQMGPAGFKRMARDGYIVITGDTRSSGERMDYPWLSKKYVSIGGDDAMNNVASAMGMSILGMQVWDMMRIADYAVSRDDCDGRIAVGGSSGGGHVSLFFAAMDERVQAMATSAWYYNFKDAHLEIPHNCGCNFVPDLWTYFDCGDIGALCAPRAMLVETGMGDRLNSQIIQMGNVIEPYDVARRCYALFGAEDKLQHHVSDGGHGGETGSRANEEFHPFMYRHIPINRGEA